MSEPTRHEKDEKNRPAEEKAEEKQEEKQQEKRWDEKVRRDPLGSITWAVILIWAGLVLLGENLGLLTGLRGLGLRQNIQAWSIILAGAGVIVLLEVAVRLLVPAYRRPVAGSVVFAAILIGVGLGDVVGWSVIWPVILIVGGGLLLLESLIGRR